ncbi:hypothetical protein [Candidatus Azobacteroides pseudotrichonymphae]|uniref:Uncharacterized protein n=1 Tax=Azobacteroides pseudotrichonymphae genomovar. CFP2 TaxID=511995 RepID=B6YQ25_AZOPC|nr:hypothetical protein [Candidatus Azobacteroides pseudotrichonymphae]BAG83297.1 conserved hypothetical protein [Candidatus Azobacteroides pseudotrichonymphae genomovar. CFP2]
MTKEESELLSVFESHLRRLMFLCDELKVQKKTLQELCEKLEQENKTWRNKYDNLKMARIISVKQDDFEGAKNKLAQLIKKVDKCIALLNT